MMRRAARKASARGAAGTSVKEVLAALRAIVDSQGKECPPPPGEPAMESREQRAINFVNSITDVRLPRRAVATDLRPEQVPLV